MALVKCPECKSEISDKATSCPKCGFPITVKKEAQIPSPNKPSKVETFEQIPLRVCPGCQAEVSDKLASCPKCGRPFPNEEWNEYSTPAPLTSGEFSKLFFEVWKHPRKVIQRVMGNGSDFFVWPMLLTYALLQALHPDGFTHLSKFLSMPAALLAWVVFNIAVGSLLLLVASWFIYVIGSFLLGKASYKKIRAAFVWAFPPLFFGIIFSSIADIPNWIKIFNGTTNIPEGLNEPKALWQVLTLLVAWFFNSWSLILNLINVAEAQEFSVGKAILCYVILIFIIVVVAWGGGYLIGMMGIG